MDCTNPGTKGIETNADLVLRLIDYDGAILLCNADKEALRVWSGNTKR